VTINTPLALQGSQTFTNNSANGLTIGAGISGGSGYNLTKAGTGVLTLTTASTYSGATAVNEGTLAFTGGGAVGASTLIIGQAGSTSPAFVTLSASGGSSTRSAGLLVNGTPLTSSTNNVAVLTVSNTNTSNSNENFGALTLSSGAFRANVSPNSTCNTTLVFGSITRNAGTQLNFDRVTGGTILNAGTTSLASLTANTVNIKFNTAPTLTGGGGTSGSNTISILPYATVGDMLATYDPNNGLRGIQSGEMILVTSASATQNAYVNTNTSISGTTTVNSLTDTTGGTIIISGSGTLHVTSGAIMANTSLTLALATLDFGTTEGNVHVANNRTLTINSVITGSGGLTVGLEDSNTNATSLVLGGSNTFTGVTALLGNNTNLKTVLTNGQALQNSTLDYNNYGASLQFGNSTANVSSVTLGGLKGAQNLALTNSTSGAVALTVGSSLDSDDTIYSGALSGSGSLTKAGGRKLTLAGANSYTGATSITDGTLAVNGSLVAASTVTVGNASTTGLKPTLSGGGIIAGSVTILGPGSGSAGHLAPGNSVGTLEVGNLTLADGSVLDYEFTTGANDFTKVNSTLTLPVSGTVPGTVGINLYAEGTANAFSFSAGTYRLFEYGVLDGPLNSLKVLNPVVGTTYKFQSESVSGNNYVDLIVSVPEPATLSIMLAATALGLGRRRRRCS
jgi:autotransporter-associated beta strand protein